jgi:phosphoglycerol transferase
MPLFDRNTNRTSILWAIAVALSALMVGGLTVGGAGFNIYAPLNYSGDSIFYLMTTQRLGEGTGYLINSRQGFPFGSQLFDFVGSDWGNMLVLSGLYKASGSEAWANNVYFLIGFPLSALAAFWCLRRLGISNPTSATFSLLFAITPFHFLRFSHLYFTWYFVIPLYCWFAFELFYSTDKLTARWPLKAAALMGLAAFGVYYAWFGCLVLTMGAVLGWLRHRTAKPILAGVVAVAFVGAGVGANLLPNMYLMRQLEKNTEIGHRLPFESELYGLKIIQLALPRPGHRLDELAAITANYGQTFPNVNENMTSALGFVGVVGFFLVLAGAIVYTPRIQEQRRSQLFMLGATTILLLLMATTGGFSALFSLLVTPLIRGWNRVSIFIAFLSLAGLAVAIECVRHRFAPTGRASVLAALGLAGIAAFGIWDQTAPGDRVAVQAARAEFRRDEVFFRKVEASLPEGSAIYQVPFMRFPEAEPKSGLGSYDLGKGFLHSQSLKWSYGIAAGRHGSDFLEDLSAQPISIQLEAARFLGFSGFLVDRRGYADRGKAVEAEAVSGRLAGTAPIEDEGKNLAFYSLQSLPEASSPDQLSPETKAWLERWKVSKVDGSLTLPAQSPAPISPKSR